MAMIQTRRRFLTNAAFAGAAGLLRAPPSLAAEGALETTTVRIVKTPVICLAPQDVSEDLLRAEGFTDIRYVEYSPFAHVEAISRPRVYPFLAGLLIGACSEAGFPADAACRRAWHRVRNPIGPNGPGHFTRSRLCKAKGQRLCSMKVVFTPRFLR
jgi:hypothetical protein